MFFVTSLSDISLMLSIKEALTFDLISVAFRFSRHVFDVLILRPWVVRDVRNRAVAASPLNWHSSHRRFHHSLLHSVIPSAPGRSPYDCSLPSLIGFDDEEVNRSLQKGSFLRWPGGAGSHR